MNKTYKQLYVKIRRDWRMWLKKTMIGRMKSG